MLGHEYVVVFVALTPAVRVQVVDDPLPDIIPPLLQVYVEVDGDEDAAIVDDWVVITAL